MLNLGRFNPFKSSRPLVTTEIAELRIYPIKGCRGVSVSKCTLTRQGLSLDRRWMLVDAEKNNFLTIREIPGLTLVDTAFELPASGSEEDLELVISIRHTDKSIRIPAYPSEAWLEENASLQTVTLWGIDTDGYVYDDNVNKLFQENFKLDMALVYKGPSPRFCLGNGSIEQLGRAETTNFPDFLPVSIANQASVAELNTRLKTKGAKPVTIEHFRPNIIVRGATEDGSLEEPRAWTEDQWKMVRVRDRSSASSLEIDVVSRCTRCRVPNVDPDSATKDPHEPWRTIVSYRRIDPGDKWRPCFGMLSCPRNEGEITVGMVFEVMEFTDEHWWLN